MRTAFDAADDELLTVETLAAIDAESWQSTTFTPHPSFCLLKLEWEVEALWQTMAEHANTDTAEPMHRPHHLLMWRAGLTTHWRLPDDTEAQLLTALADGKSFSDLCTLAAELVGEDQAALPIAGLLRRWIEEGLLLVALEVGNG